jgi:hypothetical protein
MAAICALVLLAWTAGANAQNNLVDKLLAVLGNAAITMADVDLEKRILPLAKDSLLYPGQEGQMTAKQVFHELVARELLYGQAVKLGFSTVPDKERRKVLEQFATQFATPDDYLKFLRKLNLRAPQFDERMEGNASWPFYRPIWTRFKEVYLVRQYVEKKVGLQVKLGLASELEKRKDELAAKNPGADEPRLKQILEKEMFAEKLKSLVDDAASLTDITYYRKDYADILD